MAKQAGNGWGVTQVAKGMPIYSYVASEDGLMASSHYFTTERGVVLFDTQFLVDEAETLHQQIRANTGGEVALIVITHPHPDHYGGAGYFRRHVHPRPKFYSTETTARVIEEEAKAAVAGWRPRYGRRLPRSFVVPRETFTGHLMIEFKGLTLELHEIHRAESRNGLVAWIPQSRTLVAGDLVYNKVHLWLTEGRSAEWIAALQWLRRFDAKQVLPGHGFPAGPEIIPHLIRYIEHFQAAVNRFTAGKDQLSDADVRRIRQVMMDKYPDYHLEQMLELSVPAEFTAQRQRAA